MKQITALIGTAALLNGWASVKFYKDPKLSKKNEVGIKLFFAKPYLLDARVGTSKVTGATVVHLPDVANPVYAKARSG